MSESKEIDHALILMAMYAEAAPIIEALELREDTQALDPRLPMRCFRGHRGALRVSLVIAGMDERHGVDLVGSEPATLMAYTALTRLAPSLVLSAGTAGGFSAKGASIGTVYLSDQHFVYHDRHVPLPGLDASAVGRYPALPVRKMASALGLPVGVVSTGSSLEKSDKDLRVIVANNAVAKEMEAAAIAWVAQLLSVPVMAVKSITNLVDLDNQSEAEFMKHFEYASLSLRDALLAVLDYLSGRSTDQL